MSGPERAPRENRDDVIRARVTTSEKAYVQCQAEAAGLSEAEYLRRRSLDYRVTAGGAARRADPALITELNRLGLEMSAIGNNANQLARSMNSGRRFRSRWEDVADEIERLRARVEGVLERVVLDQEGSA